MIYRTFQAVPKKKENLVERTAEEFKGFINDGLYFIDNHFKQFFVLASIAAVLVGAPRAKQMYEGMINEQTDQQAYEQLLNSPTDTLDIRVKEGQNPYEIARMYKGDPTIKIEDANEMNLAINPGVKPGGLIPGSVYKTLTWGKKR